MHLLLLCRVGCLPGYSTAASIPQGSIPSCNAFSFGNRRVSLLRQIERSKLHDLAQSYLIGMQVVRGRPKVGMSEQLPDRFQIAACLHQVGSIEVP